MADSATTNFSFIESEVTLSNDTWGDKLNSNWNLLDRLIRRAPGVGAAEAVTIASGVITPNGPVLTVDTESSASTDDLDTINTDGLMDVTSMIMTGVAGTFQASETITGGTSSATANIVSVDHNYTDNDSSADITRITVDTISGTFTDGETITGGTSSATGTLDIRVPSYTGTVLILSITDDARNVVVKNGTGNIYTHDGNDLTLDTTKDFLVLAVDGTDWREVSRSLSATDADDISDTSSTNKFTTAADIAKLAAIESAATADQTGAEIKALYEAEANTNAFTDAYKTKVDGIESGATADQTGAEIKSLYEAESDTNAFTDADHSKLDGIASGAEVNPDVVPQAEAEAGSATTERIFTALRVKQAIDALAPGGAGDTLYQPIQGLTCSNGTTTNTLDIAAGSVGDAQTGARIVLASDLNKDLDAAWAVGDTNGALDTGSGLAADQIYAVWLIKRSDTAVEDVLISTSFTWAGVTKPTNYDQGRLIWAVGTDSSQNIKLFRQLGNYCSFTENPNIDITDSSATNNVMETGTLYSVPPDCVADINYRFLNTGGTASVIYGGVMDGDSSVTTLGGNRSATLVQNDTADPTGTGSRSLVATNSSQEIIYGMRVSGTASITINISVNGFFLSHLERVT